MIDIGDSAIADMLVEMTVNAYRVLRAEHIKLQREYEALRDEDNDEIAVLKDQIKEADHQHKKKIEEQKEETESWRTAAHDANKDFAALAERWGRSLDEVKELKADVERLQGIVEAYEVQRGWPESPTAQELFSEEIAAAREGMDLYPEEDPEDWSDTDRRESGMDHNVNAILKQLADGTAYIDPLPEYIQKETDDSEPPLSEWPFMITVKEKDGSTLAIPGRTRYASDEEVNAIRVILGVAELKPIHQYPGGPLTEEAREFINDTVIAKPGSMNTPAKDLSEWIGNTDDLSP